MKNRAFHFEIKDLLTQFIAAFDDTVISRFNKNRNPGNDIEVRYVFAPKQRVMYDIINKAQNITLPVVAVNLTGISRDNDRVFNKLAPSYIPAQREEDPKAASKFMMPVPVNLEVSMSILARYMQDVDQIVSNFVPYNNPYIILTWEVPEDYGAQYPQEIRSEVLWSGDLAYTNYLYFTKATWEATGAVSGTEVSDAKFPAGTAVSNVQGPLEFGGTEYYKVTFSQTSIANITAGSTVGFLFGQPPYAQLGETVFSFIGETTMHISYHDWPPSDVPSVFLPSILQPVRFGSGQSTCVDQLFPESVDL